MKTFLANLLFAWLWAVMTVSFSLANLLVGFVVGYAVLWLATRFDAGRRQRRTQYFRKAQLVLSFAASYVRDLLLMSLRVAYDVVTPSQRMRPVVIGIPLEEASDAEITLMANLITLTPGSVALDVTADRRTLYLHSMFGGEDIEKLRRRIKDTIERRVLELTR